MEFTGKERDRFGDGTVTGLDFFGARYYSGTQGRFTTPDPLFMTDQRTYDPQQWNMYAYARNNPLKYIDPDGRAVTFANEQLARQFLTVALQSDSLWNEYVEAYRDDKMDVQVVGRGLKKNEQGSLGDATVFSTDENGVTKVVMYVDASRTSEDTVTHEWGHERDARLMGGTAFVRQGKQELKQYPDKSQHNERPLEKSADRFKDTVNKERKEYQRRLKEQKKAEQRAEKERKKRPQPDEN